MSKASTSEPIKTDAVIIGAGPVGLFAVCLLYTSDAADE